MASNLIELRLRFFDGLTFGEVLPKKSIGVFIGTSLPRALRITEVDLHAGGQREVFVVRHLASSVPGKRQSQFFGELADVRGERLAHGHCVLAVEFHEHGEAREALNERRDASAL